MELDEAAQIAQQGQKLFQAFAKIGELVTTASKADVIVAELTRKRNALKETIDSLSAQQTEKEQRIAQMQGQLEEGSRSINAKLAGAMANMQAEREKAEAAHGVFMKSIQDTLAEAKADFEIQRTRMNVEISELSARRDALKTEVDRILGAVSKLG